MNRPNQQKSHQPDSFCLGVIMLDTRFPRLLGDIGNPDTFDFPVVYETVGGAFPERVVVDQDKSLLQPYICAGNRLIERGATLISTSCGFLAYFQKELQRALEVPVLTSALFLVPKYEFEFGEGKVGILTISEENLGTVLLEKIGISAGCPLASPDRAGVFATSILGNQDTLDVKRCETEMIEATEKLLTSAPNTKAIVLECTNMVPHAHVLEKVFSIPAYSIVSRIYDYHVHGSVAPSH